MKRPIIIRILASVTDEELGVVALEEGEHQSLMTLEEAVKKFDEMQFRIIYNAENALKKLLEETEAAKEEKDGSSGQD